MDGEILLIGDHSRVLERSTLVLSAQGYALSGFGRGPAALRHLDETRTALVVLAIAPVERDWSFCRRLLASSGVPLLLLIVGGDEVDRVQGLELGADDCAGWPLPDSELRSRAHALLRSASRPGAARRAPAYFADGDLVIDLTRPEVWRDGEPVAVSATELKVLACFVRHAGQVVSPECLAAEVWAPVRAGTGHRVSPYIHSLRAKLERDPAHPRRLLTRHGQGYLFVPLADGG